MDSSEIYANALLEEALDDPQPDALAPEALREELINIVSRKGLPMARTAAEIKVDAVLAKLAEYYASVAVPEVQAPIHEQYDAIMRLEFMRDRIINAGASMSSQLAEEDPLRKRWIDCVAPFREAVSKIVSLLS